MNSWVESLLPQAGIKPGPAVVARDAAHYITAAPDCYQQKIGIRELTQNETPTEETDVVKMPLEGASSHGVHNT